MIFFALKQLFNINFKMLGTKPLLVCTLKPSYVRAQCFYCPGCLSVNDAIFWTKGRTNVVHDMYIRPFR